MLQASAGNLIHADVEALVNTVNTAGVMGKGLALQFKQAYPAMFRAYESACKAREVQLGQVHIIFCKDTVRALTIPTSRSN